MMESLNRSLEVSKLIKEVLFMVKHGIGKEMENAGLPGITPSQGLMIGLIGKHGKMKVSELSEKLGLNNSTTSGMIDRLEKQGVVERLRSEEDKRVVFIRLSPKLSEMESEIHNKIDGIVEKLIAKGGTEEDYDKIIEGLTILKRLLTEKLGR